MPFYSPGHPATVEILQAILPGKKVRDFSIHFPMKGAAYIRAMIYMEPEECDSIADVFKRYKLTAGEES